MSNSSSLCTKHSDMFGFQFIFIFVNRARRSHCNLVFSYRWHYFITELAVYDLLIVSCLVNVDIASNFNVFFFEWLIDARLFETLNGRQLLYRFLI